MLTSNPPHHTRLRSPARGPFMPRGMERLRGRIKEIVDERLDMVAAKGDPPSVPRIQGTVTPIFIAGFITTANLIGGR
jgi:cytochrome P450